MKKPIPPCYNGCDKRSVGCHSEICPYGWIEYQKKQSEFNEYIKKQKEKYISRSYLTDSKRKLAHKNTLKRKQKGKI